MNKTELKYLSCLKYHPSFIEKINRINSDALFCIAAKDCEGLETCLNNLIEWRKQTGDIDFSKQDYQEAMEYFLKKFKVIRQRMTIEEFNENIAPHMQKGFVFMNENGGWMYCQDRPELFSDKGYWSDNGQDDWLPFDIVPVDNWKESLIEVGNAR